MSYGLVVRDSGGNIMYDIGDYACRFIKEMTVVLPANQKEVWVSVGYDHNTHFAAIMEAHDGYPPTLNYSTSSAVLIDGNIRIRSNDAWNTPRTYMIDIYSFG